jgi:uncharacterized protein (TIGR03086 family)
MTSIHSLQEAVTLMQSVIDAESIDDRDRSRPTPCAKFDVEQLSCHVIDTHTLFLVGTGGEPVKHSGSLSERHAAVAAAAVEQWSRRGTGGAIDLGGNDVPAGFGLALHTLETYVHAWDLAQSLCRPFDPPTDLTSQMWEFAEEFISEDLRGDEDGAPYGLAITIDDADGVDRLVAFTGRDPRAFHS